MKRVLKKTVLLTGLTAIVLAVVLTTLLAWMVHSEQGSRWLLEQGVGFAPVTIEANGISGTLADGLTVESLSIILPLVEVHTTEFALNWNPTSLLTGVVDIDSARISELSVDLLETEHTDKPSDEPVENQLFWLQLPIHLHIKSAQLDTLRIDNVVFKDLSLSGTIGHERLEIETLKAQTAGIKLQVSGELVGPDPGQLQAIASWEMPAENLSGSGSFSGDIEELGFTQVIKVPETVNFKGTIYHLFNRPRLAGIADWSSVRLPGQTSLYSKSGNIAVSSDFLTARLEGDNIVLFEDWPQAPMQLKALVGLQGVTIDTYSIETLDGQITGSGQIDYGNGLQGQLLINATQIDTGLINSDLPGRLGFDSSLLIESANAFVIDVATANAQIADRDFTGLGRVLWSGGKLTAIDADVYAGTNKLSADIKMGPLLAGSINANAPELAMLWPGLQGKLEASIVLGGSPEHPQARLLAEATSVSLGSRSLDRFTLSGELQSNGLLAGKLVATGLVAGKQQLGNLDFSLTGSLADHQSTLSLTGGMVELELRASGGWQDEHLTQSFKYGQVQLDGFASWQLEQNPELRLSAKDGQLSPHCWRQQKAGICIKSSHWDAESLQSAIIIDNFALATLQPLLAEGYSIDGTVNADIKLKRNTAGVQGELHWQQSRTLLGYADDIDKFQTVINEVQIDLLSDDTQTKLTASLTGEQGLNITTTAKVSGALVPKSRLKATTKGSLPDIGLLRPLLQRVVNPGELSGELKIDLRTGGTVGDPVFTGGAYLSNGALGLLGPGITLSDINITARSDGSDKLQVTGQLRSGDGNARISGEVQTTENMGLVADIHIQGQNLASVRLTNLSLDSSPDLTLRISEDMFDISGTILIPDATAQIRDLPRNAVPRSADVIVHAPDRAVEPQVETIVTGNVEVILGEQVRFNGFGLNSRLEGRLRLTQSRGDHMRSGGTVRVRDGFLTGYGRELRVDRGELTFTGPLDDPLINIQVSRESIYDGRQYTIGLRLTGSAQNVKTEPFSRPAMSEQDIQSFLLLDRPANIEGGAGGAALALGLQQLVPLEGDRFGLDEVSFETNDANEAAMVAGKRINDRLYVRYVFGSFGQPGAFRIRYSLGRGFSLESSTGARQSLDLLYLFER